MTEKIWTVLGCEFGEDSVRMSIVVCALYGLNSVGDEFLNHLSDCMHHLVFLPCPYDLYMWINPKVRPEDGFNYFSYVLIYVDDVLVVHHDAKNVPRIIYECFNLKPSSIGDSDI